jgi:hypothetical protein
MLGCFLSLIRFKFARRKFRFHRMRIAEFLAEEKLDIALPTSQKAYNAVADTRLQEVLLACRTRSAALHDFTLLGALAPLDAMPRLSEDAQVVEELRPEAIRILERHKLDGARLYQRYLAYVRMWDDGAKESGETDPQADTFLTPAMDLLTATLEPLKTDRAMCFVAMPFKQPYATYFERFYRPLAAEMDCRAFRMWGGLSGEAYVELMLTIMRRCRVVIADLSEANKKPRKGDSNHSSFGNVLYEFAAARGLNKVVIPLCRPSSLYALPSNIASDQMLQVYSPREKDWPELVAMRCGRQVDAKDFARKLAEKALADARWTKGDRLPRVPAFGEDRNSRESQKRP